LDRAKLAYVFPEKVEILSKDVIEREREGQEELQEDGDEARETEKIEENNVSKSRSDVSDVNWLSKSGQVKEDNEDSTDISGVPGPKYEGTSSFITQENSPYTFKQENTSHSLLHYSKELFQLVHDNEQTNPFVKVIKKGMRDMEQKGSNDGYSFTKEDYVYAQMMEPNERWNIEQAEQTFHALLEDGKIMKRTEVVTET
jgi:hypothetical protein